MPRHRRTGVCQGRVSEVPRGRSRPTKLEVIAHQECVACKKAWQKCGLAIDFAGCRPLIMNKARLVVAPATTAYKHSLKEVFSAPGIVGQIKASLASTLGYD